MANIKSSIKRIRISQRNRLRNQAIKSHIKWLMKHATKDEVESAIDKAVNKGVIHRNKAVRMKSKYERSHSRSTQ
uniref:Small ribosomal subunit protein bS20c n=2 Tax=Cyanidioschyzon merolae TaxID=45157 RepID=RR20_CYAM1|nr:ribosomal protein S20 [Cyanidioschyzon merolae strain 10D]Q85FR8.1 RecName: Full=Small ribosomal subunit protein bS20c; AltName: Full=30S ribosomal protein S20, chloroplastic [Cyanidioschyzon merolae strain 10D]QFV17062.1 30S ribosomal protein S20 [Cyanidioschyzon merolae]QFV17235.1 30S ribosomal protein S20 [Cyanidioschyzon merolae]BAC76277.1 30S ribosomal protein S20 [Cyanidioschyzon merolae strain 10D]